MGKWIIRLFLLIFVFVGSYFAYNIFLANQGLERHVSAAPNKPLKPKSVKNKPVLSIENVSMKKLRLDIKALKHRQISVYYVPHPDDELLSYGVPIRNDLHAGKVVYLVLFTHGEGSSTILKVVNQVVKPKLTRTQMGLARVREFMRSTEDLGIDSNHKDVYDPQQQSEKRALIRKIALYFENNFPNVTQNGLSRYDVLPDHADTGTVLDELYKEGKIKHKRIFASIYMSRFAKHRLTGTKILPTYPSDDLIFDKAIFDYMHWDPHHGWYACGYISVHNQFNAFLAHKYSIEVNE